MNRTRQLVIDFILFAVLAAFLLTYFGVIDVDVHDILSFGLMSYGIVSVYFALGTHRRGHLFISTILFMLGVIIYVVNHYNFINPNSVILPAMLFITASGFLMLYIDESNNRVFLISAIVLLAAFGFYIWLGRNIRIFSFANTVAGVLLDYYPFVIILVGIIILLNRKR